MVIDYLVHGKHVSGHNFFVPVRIWGPRAIDFDQRLRRILENSDEVNEWEVEEKKTKWLLSFVYDGEGHSELRFIFYEEGELD